MEYQLKEWVVKAKSGDKDAMMELMNRMYPLMVTLIRRYGRGEWEDLLQESRETLHRCVLEYDEEKAVPFLVYAKKALYYKVRNFSRSKGDPVSLDAPVPGREEALVNLLESSDPEPFEALWSHEEKELLQEALKRITKEQREVLLLHYYGRFSLKEIAKGRGVHYQTVKGLKKRAVENLKKMLSAIYQDAPS